MNCYDSAQDGQIEAALGVCTNCGAGVCQQHMVMDKRRIEEDSMASPTMEATRQVLCVSCDQVLGSR
jgi:hypothetical protein